MPRRLALLGRLLLIQPKGAEVSWRHTLTFVKRRGKLKGYCSCGWQSPSSNSEQQILSEYKAHTKLVEREGRSAREGGA